MQNVWQRDQSNPKKFGHFILRYYIFHDYLALAYNMICLKLKFYF